MKNIIVKSFVLFLLTVILANTASASPLNKRRPVKPVRITSVGATVAGFVELSGTKDTPEDLQNIFQGSDLSHLGTKMIYVKGTYKAGAKFVTVEEDKIVGSSTPKYWFSLPVPAKVSAYSHGIYSIKDTLATLAYASQDAIAGTSLAEDSHELEKLFKKKVVGGKKKTFAREFKQQLKNLAIQKFHSGQTSSIVDVGALMSVERVTANKGKRPSNTATLTGALSRPGSTTRGRFQLDMTFDQ